jgi:hypothetical protein
MTTIGVTSMRIAAAGTLALCLGLAASIGALADEPIYKAVEAGGGISYSSQPDPGARLVGNVVAGDATPDQLAAQQRFQQEESTASRTAEDYAAKLEQRWVQVDHDIAQAQSDLQLAEMALQEGGEPLPGERLGIDDGYSRLTPAYFDRLRELQSQVDLANRRLDTAYRARDELK